MATKTKKVKPITQRTVIKKLVGRTIKKVLNFHDGYFRFELDNGEHFEVAAELHREGASRVSVTLTSYVVPPGADPA